MRPLTARDAKSMAAIHAESFERSWDALEMAAHVQKDICFGADQQREGQPDAGQQDVLAGFIIISRAADQAEILTLATAKSARRQGLGQQLLKVAEQELSKLKVTELFLEVAEDNTAAIALYRRAQFTPIGRRPAYYRRAAGRMAALTFSKKI